MTTVSPYDRQRAFGVWLRTGRLPPIRSADGLELKFNPYMTLEMAASLLRRAGCVRSADPSPAMRQVVRRHQAIPQQETVLTRECRPRRLLRFGMHR